MQSMMTAPAPVGGGEVGVALNTAPLVYAITRLTPDLWEPGLLPGETGAEREARHVAALDILDDLLAEAADVAEPTRIGGGR